MRGAARPYGNPGCGLGKMPATQPRTITVRSMSNSEQRAMNILRELHAAEKELVGRAVVLTDGKAGTIDHVFVDDVHGLRISIRGHDGRWPISTVKHIQT